MGGSIQSFGKTREGSDCVWMQAGAVRKKTCRIYYRCHECRFDRMLRKAVKENYRRRDNGEPLLGRREQLVFWKDILRRRPPWKQPCIHHMKGRIEFRTCTNGYRCGDCEFDQFFQDQFAVHAVIRPVGLLSVKGVDIPHGVYLHPGHVWARIEEDGAVRVGLDDFARRVLGPLDRIEAPLVGKAVARGGAAFRVFRKGEQTDFSAPVSGVVTDVNAGLREAGGGAHEDPYASGWIMRLHSESLRQDLRGLMIGAETRAFLDKEVDRLFQVIEETTGPLAADGGTLGDDIFGNLPGIGWERLNRSFFNKPGQ
jgi:glycine cleavage system H lipoate-binding protein